MKYLLISLVCLSALSCLGQSNLKGVWQGILLRDGVSEKQSSIIYLDLEVAGTAVTGRTRDEAYGTEYYAVQKIKGTLANSRLQFKQFVVEKKRNSAKITWCSIDVDAQFTDSTGYLTGTFTSSTCKRNSGKIILYRSKALFSRGDSLMLSQGWRDVLLDDLKKGRKAPEIRARERQNFKFQPIYFDYDKDEIRENFHAYLNEMIRVVNGHTDLRIQITGHTDSDGSDGYNDGLSARRAKAILEYFTTHGLAADKLIIDFRGEKMPVDTNDTPEGKQHNRRVDFEFI
jgi:OOP family OmpA-OmpF porin